MRKWVPPILLLCFIAGFFVRETLLRNTQGATIFVEENGALFFTGEGCLFGMGRIDSPKVKSLARGLLPFFTTKDVSSFWDIPVGQAAEGNHFSLQRVSQNLVRTTHMGHAEWWIGEDFSSEEQALVVKTGVEFSSDWWVMIRNTVPEFLPLPTQGILFAGDRVPSKKTSTFAQERSLPLITATETNGFSLSLLHDQWELKTRQEDL